jgi:hypothetical protein
MDVMRAFWGWEVVVVAVYVILAKSAPRAETTIKRSEGRIDVKISGEITERDARVFHDVENEL